MNNKKYALVIVETRELTKLCEIIDNHLAYTPKDWDLIVFGSILNKEMLKRNYKNIVFHQLEEINYSASEYNNLLTSTQMWEKLVEYERVLIFQHDSRLLRKGIEKFLSWDYIGAPWAHIKIEGGNGGLSIRNPKKMLELCNKQAYNPFLDGNEDIYFCLYLPLIGASIAPREVAMMFSVETTFYPEPVGIHAADKHLKAEQYEALLKGSQNIV